MFNNSSLAFLFISLLCVNNAVGQCLANAGLDIAICDGDGSSSNYTYLDGTGSAVDSGEVNYEWTVLNEVGDGSWQETLVITNSESDEPDPRFKYPKELASDTEFSVQLRVFDDNSSCEDFDTLLVFIQSNMCPRADAGEDQTLSNGCDFQATFDGSDSEDPQEEELSYSWSSLDGYDANFLVSDQVNAVFAFPETEADQTFSFKLTVSDAIQSKTDTLKVFYLDNDAPVADAGTDISTCEYQFHLSANQSYDVNWNELTYDWTSLDGLSIVDANTSSPLVTSPTDLNEAVSYRFALEINDGFCSAFDTVIATVAANLCPVANAGETRRLPKFESPTVMLDASNSFDPDGESVSYEWTTPSGNTISEQTLSVSDLDPESRHSSYTYVLKVMDSENSISMDTVEVIYSNFSAPVSPTVYAVASHGQVLVSWDASSEASYDSLTGYSDFEGYKLYRSIDGGKTWGGDADKLYDYNGEFVGWVPYAQYDLDYDEDYFHCIYNHNGDCEPEEARQTSIGGLDPYLPRFTLGSNTGLEYSYVDSNVIDGVEYTYTVTAYDMGLPKFTLNLSEIDSSGIFSADTLWAVSNPGEFYGPDSIDFYNEAGNWIRKDANPNRGYPFLESAKGDSGDHNFITVVPGYTALDISFPDAKDIEALFTSNALNIGTGDRDYFIVDRTKIVQDQIRYEVQARQSSSAVEGMACEDPLIFGYVVEDSIGTPASATTYYEENLNFFEKDSISGLPGVVYENGSYIVPNYDIISPVDKWSNQFKGIRFKIENKIPLEVSAVPPVSLDTLLWSWQDPDSMAMDSATVFGFLFSVLPELSYTNVASYLRRLNFDYKLEFVSEPDSGTAVPISNTNGPGKMYFPFKVVNMWTGKEVGILCNDYGSFDASPIDYPNGAANYVWTPGEDIFLIQDSLRIAGAWVEAYNYNLELSLPVSNSQKNRKAYDDGKEYAQGDTVFYQGSLWYAKIPADPGVEPLSVFSDQNDDGIRNNPWRPVYPWKGGEQMLIKPHKLFVDGDKWYSDMSKLGEKVGISDTLCLDSIKVVPNPYKASSKFNETPNLRRIRFTHLPTECRISVYTIAGEHVTTIHHQQQFDGNAWWNLRTGNNQDGPEVAPGLYIYVIEFPEEKEYCIDTYDDDGDIQGSLKNDYFSNDKYDNKRVTKKTQYHIGKFAVIR